MSFWQAKTRSRPSDTIFSKFIRKRDGRCVYKFKCYGYCEYENLTCSHFIKRRYESVRFDPENCDAACRKCHMWVEDTVEGKKALDEFKQKQLGINSYKFLLARAYKTSKKRDDKLDLIYAKALLEGIEKLLKEQYQED